MDQIRIAFELVRELFHQSFLPVYQDAVRMIVVILLQRSYTSSFWQSRKQLQSLLIDVVSFVFMT